MNTHPEYTNYSVGRDGTIINKTSGKVLKQAINEFGYWQVSLKHNGRSFKRKVHRLVAQTYVQNPYNKPEVNHIDCNKSNNNFDNLEWVTSQENKQHAWENGLYKDRGEEHPLSLYNDAKIHEICKLLSENVRNSDICRILDVPKCIVASVKGGWNWKHISSLYDFNTVKKPRKTEEVVRGICKEIADGVPAEIIAKKFSITKDEVSRFKRKIIHKKICDEYF